MYVRIYTYLYEIFRMCTVLWVFVVARDDDGSAINEMREEGEYI